MESRASSCYRELGLGLSKLAEGVFVVLLGETIDSQSSGKDELGTLVVSRRRLAPRLDRAIGRPPRFPQQGGCLYRGPLRSPGRDRAWCGDRFLWIEARSL